MHEPNAWGIEAVLSMHGLENGPVGRKTLAGPSKSTNDINIETTLGSTWKGGRPLVLFPRQIGKRSIVFACPTVGASLTEKS